jgi:beta-phosphoglucomutase-like phosphatase (HAD superfamily)
MDTETTLLRSWQHEWRQWGLELKVATFFADHGGDVNAERTALLAAAVGADFDAALSLSRRLEHRATLQSTLDLSVGIQEWIAEAAGLLLRVAVASSSPIAWLEENLGRAGVRKQFDVIATGDEVRHHKPHPDVYHLALRRLGLSGHQAVAVEDTAHGVDAAHAAGMRCIAIPNAYVEPSRVRHADLVLGSAADLTLSEALDRAAGPTN